MMSDADKNMVKKVRGFEILKIGRGIRGMTQSEVAERFGVGDKTYRRWEQGECPVSYDALMAICEDVFRLPLIEVMGMAQIAH
ncbi:helix-turn-helix domain-containing protein [Shewanella surugensis]|uniref:Helix-turn-helix domain-containing protein n=1 Tax=Shewanella surugensis TaxID=212020 RepID=A0ABT0L932_9GAMM|nr:helix-turn-helix transcriptional regulator [Shewanella surugensis]MCL1124216.1 helix-turn-helix domain-containing protein [Shewanella surugensis]